jgi:nucleotide-binding universal stress UspA family protein
MRQITVAIHTYDRAVELKNRLENEGITAVLQNVNLESPVVSAGVRVRINEDDLPLALRIIENPDIFQGEGSKSSLSHSILVPIDFSEHSLKAAKVAMDIALQHNADVVFLYAYIDPYVTGNVQLTDTLTFDLAADSEARKQFEQTAQTLINRFSERLREKIKRGDAPAVKFSTVIAEGVPEDAIIDFAKEHTPYLIVMGTRGSERKNAELIGSVTAEVLDKCRITLLCIPEPFTDVNPYKPQNILMFSNLEQEDILAIDTMSRIFRGCDATVTIAHIPGKKRMFEPNSKQSMQSLLNYCTQNYPAMKFCIEELSLDNATQECARIEAEHNINLIVVPNKRKNVFARFFNPGLAHRILANADLPLLVIRV